MTHDFVRNGLRDSLRPVCLRSFRGIGNGVSYFFRMWHSITFQSLYINQSQIDGVRDGNWFYIFTCYFSKLQLTTHSSNLVLASL
jgi:hypothetical protein